MSNIDERVAMSKDVKRKRDKIDDLRRYNSVLTEHIRVEKELHEENIKKRRLEQQQKDLHNKIKRDEGKPYIDNGRVCVICKDAEASCTAIPCGHFNYCIPCINRITSCAICNTLMTRRQRTYA